MAQIGETDDAFIREVDEGYRRDQLADFWKSWGRWLIALVVIGLAALAGWLWWQGEQVRRDGVAGETFSRALTKLETGNTPEATPLLTGLASGDNAGYATLAKLTLAANAVQAGDTTKGIRLYTAIADDTTQPQPFRDLALIKAVRLDFDALPPATVIAKLKPLSLPGNPWFGVAGEMTAIAQLKLGQPQLAGALLAGIARDTSLPPSLRGRAQQLAGSLGVATGQLKSSAETAK